jgi:hypothetical protein
MPRQEKVEPPFEMHDTAKEHGNMISYVHSINRTKSAFENQKEMSEIHNIRRITLY